MFPFYDSRSSSISCSSLLRVFTSNDFCPWDKEWKRFANVFCPRNRMVKYSMFALSSIWNPNITVCSMVCAWKALHLDPGLTYKSHNNKKSVHTVHFFVFPPKIYFTAHLSHTSVRTPQTCLFQEVAQSDKKKQKTGKCPR